MKLTLPKSTLSSAIGAASSVVSGRHAQPVLSFAKLDAAHDTFIIGADPDCHYRRTVNASVDAPGSCLLPVSRVKEWIGEVSGSEVTIESDGKYLTLSTPEGGPMKFSVYPPDEFPPMPVDEKTLVAEADFAPIKHISWAMMNSSGGRPQLEAVFIEHDPAGIIMAASDGRKVATVKIKAEIKDEAFTFSPLALPSKYVNLVAGLGQCQLYDSKNNLHFVGADFHLVVRKTEHGVPPWRRSISNEQFPVIGSVVVMREEFAEAINLCHIHRGNEIGSEYGVRVNIDKHNDGVWIGCLVDKTGDSYEHVIAGRIKGEFPKVTLSTERIQPFFALPDESPLKIEFTGSRTMVHFVASDIGVDLFCAPLFPREAKGEKA